jgi:sterol desaturase/sphingolipid hydroxylase (fatty acid hydroxylase superfamily)
MQPFLQYPLLLSLVLLAVAAEMLWRRRIAKRGYDFGAAAASLGIAVGGAVLKPATGAAIAAVTTLAYDATPLRLPLDDWRVWVAGFLAVEFAYYWNHRWNHGVRWLWATHAVHHSANEFTLPAAIRLGWTNLISGGWLLFVPLVLAGMPPLMLAALLGGNLAWQFFLHTEAIGRLGPLEWVLNTPAHHRVHHASNPAYLDRNFGGVLIVFDRLFGTFQAELADERPRYGLVHAMTSRNPVTIVLHEWRRLFSDLRNATSLRHALGIAFGRPG